MSEEVKCSCRKCLEERGDLATLSLGGAITTFSFSNHNRMILCPTCGNKRCPHASDHNYACTGSNEPGQEGSVY